MKPRPPTTHTATIGRYVSPASGCPNASMMKAMASTPNTKSTISIRSKPRAAGEDGDFGMANPGYIAVGLAIALDWEQPEFVESSGSQPPLTRSFLAASPLQGRGGAVPGHVRLGRDSLAPRRGEGRGEG